MKSKLDGTLRASGPTIRSVTGVQKGGAVFGDVVYLDNAAATRLDERVLEAIEPYLFDLYAVATSQFGYSLGIDARDALDKARGQIAAALGAGPEEFLFTSGSTESSFFSRLAPSSPAAIPI